MLRLKCLPIFLLFFSTAINAATLSTEMILGKSSDPEHQFKRVLEPEEFIFPDDHLAHQDYKTEWWYFSGNLKSNSINVSNKLSNSPFFRSKAGAPGRGELERIASRDFAYQFTLFRFSLNPALITDKTENSDWRSNNIYMAHVALTDIRQNKIYQNERFSRDGMGLAGVDDAEGTIKFWLNNWRAESLNHEQLFPLKLTIHTESFALDILLENIKSMVLQGDNGFSQKSSQPGNASYYYSYTRLATQGSITMGEKVFQVTGNSWLDREWSTSSLGENQQGWDWFALQLDDGSEIMLYQMRKKDGSKDVYSSATLIDSAGKVQKLRSEQFQVQAKEFWQSPVSGIRYPIKWAVQIPENNLELTVSAQVRQQEWSKTAGFSFDYWEGAVVVSGERNNQAISGVGYLEMTGYK